jgi:hypothetical protein
MEILWAIIEVLGILLDFLNILSVIADVISWVKGQENRFERKAAKRSGDTPPKRNNWNKAFIIFLILVIILTGLMVLKYLR